MVGPRPKCGGRCRRLELVGRVTRTFIPAGFLPNDEVTITTMRSSIRNHNTAALCEPAFCDLVGRPGRSTW